MTKDEISLLNIALSIQCVLNQKSLKFKRSQLTIYVYQFIIQKLLHITRRKSLIRKDDSISIDKTNSFELILYINLKIDLIAQQHIFLGKFEEEDRDLETAADDGILYESDFLHVRLVLCHYFVWFEVISNFIQCVRIEQFKYFFRTDYNSNPFFLRFNIQHFIFYNLIYSRFVFKSFTSLTLSQNAHNTLKKTTFGTL